MVKQVFYIIFSVGARNKIIILKKKRIEILDQKLCMDGMNCLNKNS